MLTIIFSELVNFDRFPISGKHNHYDSLVDEVTFTKGSTTYTVKCHIDFKYWRWFYPESYMSPMEDECEIISFDVEPIKGTKFKDGEETVLSEKKLLKLKSEIKEYINFE